MTTTHHHHTPSTYQRSGGDARGSNRARKRRKLWMLATWGDGHSCPCVHCARLLNFASVQADRIEPGGPYRRENVQPACGACNKARGKNRHWRYRPDHAAATA